MERRLLSQHPISFERMLERAFWCPSCSTWRLSRTRLKYHAQSLRQAARTVSTPTLSSHTAVNASKAVPLRYTDLYRALLDVQKKASGQVNLSRLRLALQGLESDNPTTRVAVLGIRVADTARRLVRLLLADALESEEAWEKQLTRDDPDYARGVLIRFGQTASTNFPTPTSALPILQVPSPVLQRNNIEILILPIQTPSDTASLNGSSIPLSALLSPTINTPTDAGGRQTTISQPVHKSLLVEDGLDDLISASQMLAITKMMPSDRKLVDLAVNVEQYSSPRKSSVYIFDAAKAEEGLALVRSSLGNAPEYTDKWNESRLPQLSKWLVHASATGGTDSLSRPLKDLISSILSNAASSLKAERLRAKVLAESRNLGSATQHNLEEAIGEFSRAAHQELQSGLASAWLSRNWRKLAWYKLFWRVDDVGLIITDLISNAWLPRTERAVYELSGRLLQVGISPVEFGTPPSVEDNTTEPLSTATIRKPLNILPSPLSTQFVASAEPVLVNQGGNVAVELAPARTPVSIASIISRRRQDYIDASISDLTSIAQQIVFRTLSITGLTAGLSGLAYFSMTNGSLYEAATIVALGTAFALRRMQSDWQRSCKMLENGLMDTGREVIRQLEEKMRQLVSDGSRVPESDFEVQSRRDAEAAVAHARDALNKLQ